MIRTRSLFFAAVSDIETFAEFEVRIAHSEIHEIVLKFDLINFGDTIFVVIDAIDSGLEITTGEEETDAVAGELDAF